MQPHDPENPESLRVRRVPAGFAARRRVAPTKSRATEAWPVSTDFRPSTARRTKTRVTGIAARRLADLFSDRDQRPYIFIRAASPRPERPPIRRRRRSMS